MIVFVCVTQAAGGIVVWGGEELHKFAMMRSFEKYHSDLVGLAVIAVGGLMGIIALIGFFGAKYRLAWCVGMVRGRQFCGCTLWIGLMLAAAGAGALYFQRYLDDNLTRNECLKAELFEQGDEAMQTGAALMCTYLCPCDFDSQLQALVAPFGRKLIKGSASQIEECKPCEGLTNLSPDETNAINVYLASYGLNLATCKSLTNSQFVDLMFSKRAQQVFPLLSWLEGVFNCAGLCTSTWMYSFSDVNNAVPALPTKPCYKEFVDWIDHESPIFGGIGLAFGGFLLVITGFAASLCCLQILHKP